MYVKNDDFSGTIRARANIPSLIYTRVYINFFIYPYLQGRGLKCPRTRWSPKRSLIYIYIYIDKRVSEVFSRASTICERQDERARRYIYIYICIPKRTSLPPLSPSLSVARGFLFFYRRFPRGFRLERTQLQSNEHYGKSEKPSPSLQTGGPGPCFFISARECPLRPGPPPPGRIVVAAHVTHRVVVTRKTAVKYARTAPIFRTAFLSPGQRVFNGQETSSDFSF